MHQLTIRGFDMELERHLRRVAGSLDLSLNKAALYLMRKGAGLEDEPSADVVGDSVDHLIGTWTAEDETEFRAAIRGFERIDEDLWS